MSPSWTDERIALLARLRAEGRTFGEVAAALGGGVTRNAVIGKCRRLGHTMSPATGAVVCSGADGTRATPDETDPRAARAARIAAAARAAEAVLRVESLAAAEAAKAAAAARAAAARALPPPPGGVVIIDLRDTMCRWPLETPGADSFRFCGAGRDGTSSYCDQHHSLSVHEDHRRRRRATRIMAAA